MTSIVPRARSASGSPGPPQPTKKARLDAPSASMPKKGVKGKKKKHPAPESGTADDVTLHDVYALLGKDAVDAAVTGGTEYDAPIAQWEEVELTVSELSSHGHAMSVLPAPHPPWAVLVPFALPGEKVKARINRHSKLHSYGDLVEIITPNTELRDDSRVQCKYFGTCGGCQYQMVSYPTQLELKKRVVEKAYETFSGLHPSSVPAVLATIPSPKEYGYRTKITPHFDVPPKGKPKTDKVWELRIGFDQKGRRSVMDIEECPIATPVCNEGLTTARADVKRTISTFKRGATLLLRDSLAIPPKTSIAPNAEPIVPTDLAATLTSLNSDETHVCITSHKATVRERVGSTLFEFPAGSFFQNNNSILDPLTSYVRDAIFSPPNPTSVITLGFEPPAETTRKPLTHLVDTYCGSGLFSLTLSPHFSHVAGIEIDAKSIESAKHNLSLNALDPAKHVFHAGKSEDIFASVLSGSKEVFPADQTVVVIDPPRKGCDEAFVDQVVTFGPSVLVYVSCNVHTQARDVGMLLRKMEAKDEGKRRYILESLRGFDLFPQTAHVESVAVLRLV